MPRPDHLRLLTRRSFLGAAGTAAAALALPTGLAACARTTSRARTRAALKVGLLVPLSGVYSALGKDMESGFELYLAQHDNKLGGRPVELLKGDEADGVDSARPAAQQLLDAGVVAVTGLVNSAIAADLRPTFEQRRVPLVLSNAGGNKLAGSRYVWRTSFSNRQPNAAIGRYVAEQMKGAPVYAMASKYAAGLEQLEGFTDTFKAAGGQLAADPEFAPFNATTDYSPWLSRIGQTKAKAVYAFFSGSEAVLFIRQFAQAGLVGKVPVYGPGFLTEGSVLRAQGDAAMNIKTSLHYSHTLDTPVNRAFVQAYQLANGGAMPTVFSVQSYDAASMLDKALGRLDGTVTEDALVDSFPALGEFDSPRGKWSFGPDHNPVQSMYLREVRQGSAGQANYVLQELGRVGATT